MSTIVYSAALTDFGDPADNKHLVGKSFVLEATADGSTWDTLDSVGFSLRRREGGIDQRDQDDDTDPNPIDWEDYRAWQDAGNQAFRASFDIVEGATKTHFSNRPVTFTDTDGSEFDAVEQNYASEKHIGEPETIANWEIGVEDAFTLSAENGKVKLNSQIPYISLGNLVNGYMDGKGFWVGKNAGGWKFHIGDPAGDVLYWDDDSLYDTGNKIGGTIAGKVDGWKVKTNYLESKAGTVRLDSLAPYIAVGDPVPTSYLGATGFWVGDDGGTYKLHLGNPAGHVVTWDGSVLAITGTITATSGTIGGFTLGATTLTATNLVLDAGNQRIKLGSGTDVVTLDAADATYRLAIGHSTYASAPFRVTKAGAVTATSGTIGGFTLASTTLTTTNLRLDAGNEKIVLGTGTDVVTLDAADATYRLAIGHSTYASAPFRVTKAGAVTATSGTVGGFTLGATTLTATNLVLDAGNQKLTLGTGTDVVTLDAADGTYRLAVGHSTYASAPFRVTKAGAVTASNIDLAGGSVSGTFTVSGTLRSAASPNARYELTSAGLKGYDSSNTQRYQIANDGSGWLGASGTLSWTTGGVVTAAGWTIGATTISKTGIILDSSADAIYVGSGTPRLVLDGANKRIRTSTYAGGLQGFSIEGADGSAEFNNLTARGEFHSAVFAYNEIHATAGTQGVFKSAGKLRADVTTATTPTTFNVDIDDPDTGHVQLFASGDYLRIKDGSGVDNWLLVSSVSDQITFYRYVCTKPSGSNATFRAGAAVVDYGQSGQGFLLASADDADGPFYSVRTWATNPYTGANVTERARMGNLRNSFGVGANNRYGFAAGDYSAGDYILYNPTDGLKIVGTTTAAKIALGSTPPSSASAGTGIYIDATGLYGLNNNVVMASLSAVDGRLVGIGGNWVVDDNGMQFGLGVQGKNYPGTAANSAGPGGFPWTNPSNAKAEDGVFATTVITGGGGGDTDYLFLTNFGFSLPSSATIKGIVVEVKGKGTAGVTPFRAKIVKGGALTGTHSTSSFTTSNGFAFALGSANNLWGATLSYSDVNASNFGVALYLVESEVIVPSNISVDVVRMTVYYSTLTGADVIFMNGNYINGLTALEVATSLTVGGVAVAPGNAQYVALATNATLTAERVLTGTANQITITDNGAGSTVVLSTPQNIHTGATPTFAGLTLSADATMVASATGWTIKDPSATVVGGQLNLQKNDGTDRWRIGLRGQAGSLTDDLYFIRNNGSAWLNVLILGNSTGNVTLSDGGSLVFGTSTGTKLGTSTSQKLGLWNATPIVQPTTGVATATFTANSGTTVNDASTFDGYTLKQVVKALRNMGALA